MRLPTRPPRRQRRSFASHSRSQAAFFSASPIHVDSVPYTQLPARTRGSGDGRTCLRAHVVHHFRKRHQPQVRMIGERRIQRAQEVEAVVRVVLPGVLAIQRDQQGAARLVARGDLDAFQLADEIRGRVIAMPA